MEVFCLIGLVDDEDVADLPAIIFIFKGRCGCPAEREKAT